MPASQSDYIIYKHRNSLILCLDWLAWSVLQVDQRKATKAFVHQGQRNLPQNQYFILHEP